MLIWSILLFYILIVTFIMGSLNSSDKKKKYLLLVGIAIVFVLGCRYANPNLRGDLNNYYRLYQDISAVSWNNLLSFSEMEKGYIVLNKMLSLIFNSAQTIIFAEAIICVFFTFRFIYKFCADVFLGLLTYLTGLMIFELTGFRQAIAISLCLFAVEFIQKKKLIWFLLITLLACTFHSTAIVFLPFYLVANVKPTVRNALIYGVIYAVMLNFTPTLLIWGTNVTGSDYSEAVSWGNSTGPLINISLHLISLVLLLLIKNDKIKEHKWQWNMTVLSLIIYILRFISLPFERISFYFAGGMIVALPSGLENAFEKRTSKLIKTMYIVFCIGLYLMRFKSIGYRFFFM